MQVWQFFVLKCLIKFVSKSIRIQSFLCWDILNYKFSFFTRYKAIQIFGFLQSILTFCVFQGIYPYYLSCFIKLFLIFPYFLHRIQSDTFFIILLMICFLFLNHSSQTVTYFIDLFKESAIGSIVVFYLSIFYLIFALLLFSSCILGFSLGFLACSGRLDN